MNAPVILREFARLSPAEEDRRVASEAAYARGLEDGATAAEVELDLVREQLTHQLATALAGLAAREAAARTTEDAALAALVDAVLTAIGPGLALAALREAITAEFRLALAEGRAAPPVLHIAPAHLEAIRAFVADQGLSAEIEADDALAPFSAEVIWPEGSCRLDPGDCIRRCQAIITRHLNQSPRENPDEPERNEPVAARLHAAE